MGIFSYNTNISNPNANTNMKKLIDIDETTLKALKHKAVDEGKDLKNYIQDLLKDKVSKA